MADDQDIAAATKQARDALNQITSDLEGLNRKAKDATSTSGGIGKLDVAFSGLSKTLLGTAGVAAGFYQVAKSLESVAAAGMQLQYLARDSGYAVKSVTDIQGAMRLMGASAQEANRTVGNLGEKMQSLAVFKEGSEIWQAMAKFPGAGASIANTLMNIAKEGMRTGDQMGATAKMLELFNKQSPETKFAWAQVWGESVAHLENMARKLEVVRKLAIPQLNTEEQEKYLEYMVGWQLKIEAVWSHVGAHILKRINEITEAQGDSAITTSDVIKWASDQVDQTIKDVKGLIQELKDIRDTVNTLKEGKQPFGKDYDFLNKTPAEFMHQKYLEALPFKQGQDPMGPDYTRGSANDNDLPYPRKPYPQGEDPMGADYKRGAFHSKEYWLGKRADATGETTGTSGSTDFSARRRNADELIQTEKDSSKTLVEIRDTLQRMEGGGGAGGGGDNTFNVGTGIRGGNAQASVGGFRPNRHQGGLSSADDGVGAGLQGSAFMAKRRERFAEEAKDPAVRERLMAMMQSEGTPQLSLESLANRMDYSGRTLSAGLTPAFYGPMRNGKFNAALAAIRNDPKLRAKYDRMIDNVLVKGNNVLEGRTDQGMPSDPNGMWGYGTPLWKKIGGNVFTDWGGGPGGHAGAARYREMIRRGTAGEIEAREKIDQAQQPDKWSGGLNAKVEFLNVPPGVKTSAERVGEGFNELQINRTKQGGVYNQNYGYE